MECLDSPERTLGMRDHYNYDRKPSVVTQRKSDRLAWFVFLAVAVGIALFIVVVAILK